ncbi:CDP-diacylglycerol--glycerol-3-phosphate 3-phosphatidyltransferase [hydrothermal vent metagenome]|uniref:CDP-diacylglycerol--glycerol-3-phosphate 3-phosphatidyltransferase n=1 Tax=hydrothermal vent metagenome TaxID=652676 RepID=A0A3B0R7Q6_9ZZZZ
MSDNQNIITLPNILTVSRVGLGLVMFWMLSNNPTSWAWILVLLAVLGELTDLADGFLARKFNMSSQLGAALDPLCDSLYRLTVFLGFAAAGWIPLWMVLPFAFRDIIVSYARIAAASRGVSVGARWSGKAKAVVQGVAQIAVLVLFAFGLLGSWASWLVGAAIIMTLISLVDYVNGFATST